MSANKHELLARMTNLALAEVAKALGLSQDAVLQAESETANCFRSCGQIGTTQASTPGSRPGRSFEGTRDLLPHHLRECCEPLVRQ